MGDMKVILKSLMALHRYSGHKLEELCGVPAGTTYRYLRGDHGEPKADTIQRWASAFGLTEGQLRGHVSLNPKLAAELAAVPPLDLSLPRLTAEEKEMLTVMRQINKESRRTWLRLGHELAGIRKEPVASRGVQYERKRPGAEQIEVALDAIAQPQLQLEAPQKQQAKDEQLADRRHSPRPHGNQLTAQGHNQQRGCSLKQVKN